MNPSGPVSTQPAPPLETDEDFAKRSIQEVLKAYCNALEALDPDAVKRVQPKVDIESVRKQLNSSRYKSVQCKFGDPKFGALDASAGTAKVQAELKRVYDYTILKPETLEHIVEMALSRPGPRGSWQIDKMDFKPKPK